MKLLRASFRELAAIKVDIREGKSAAEENKKRPNAGEKCSEEDQSRFESLLQLFLVAS